MSGRSVEIVPGPCAVMAKAMAEDTRAVGIGATKALALVDLQDQLERERCGGLCTLSREVVVDYYLGQYRVAVDTVYSMEVQILLNGMYDPAVIMTLAPFVRPGHVCIDIGANMGAVSMALAHYAGPEGRVYALEPHPTVFERLTANIARNEPLRGRIRPFRLAIGDKAGKGFVSEDLRPGSRGNSWISSGANDFPELLACEIVSLDAFASAQSIGRIDLVKIDVEGMEYDVILGSLRALAVHRPVVVYETLQLFEDHFVATRGFSAFQAIEKILLGLGYTLWRPVGDGFAPARFPHLGSDTVAVPEEKLAVYGLS